MLVNDSQGREVEIQVGGRYEDDIQIEEATYVNSDIEVSEEEIDYIILNGEVTFQVLAFPNETFTGSVTHIAPAVRSATRDLVFEAMVPNQDGRLRPGMFVAATLKLPDEPMPAVPGKSLRKQNGIRLFIVAKGYIEERIVQVGPEKDGYVALIDGAQLGERFVLEPSDQVKDGVAVR